MHLGLACRRIGLRPVSVGDVTSTAKGSGARFNEGKAALELIPLALLANYYRGRPVPLTDSQRAANNALFALGMFQERSHEADIEAIFGMLDADGKAFTDCAAVFKYGSQKYAPWNWAKGMAWSVVIGCAARHLVAIINGEEIDPESGLPHRGHVMCNLVMLMTFLEVFQEGDDRMPESIFQGE